MRYPETDELLSKLGLERRPSSGESLLGALIPFGVGMLVGAGVALLLAPKSGRELRAGIRHRVHRERLSVDAGSNAAPSQGALDPQERSTVRATQAGPSASANRASRLRVASLGSGVSPSLIVHSTYRRP